MKEALPVILPQRCAFKFTGSLRSISAEELTGRQNTYKLSGFKVK